MKVSGKLVIITILAVALTGAGASWWFRYAATHQVATIWGAEAALLIRDAPHVTFVTFDPRPASADGMGSETSRSNVSYAPGMIHLRNALLEDRSYDFTMSFSPAGPPNSFWTSALEFRRNPADQDASLIIYFSSDCAWAIARSPRDSKSRALPCRPIAKGLTTLFAELSRTPEHRR